VFVSMGIDLELQVYHLTRFVSVWKSRGSRRYCDLFCTTIVKKGFSEPCSCAAIALSITWPNRLFAFLRVIDEGMLTWNVKCEAPIASVSRTVGP
jgi:hypothetical protein